MLTNADKFSTVLSRDNLRNVM